MKEIFINFLSYFLHEDSDRYALHVFKAFDSEKKGYLTFQVVATYDYVE